MGTAHSLSVARRGIRLHGTLQGLGVRPAVFRLAEQLRLAGLVRNESGGVWIEVEGASAFVEEFTARIVTALPGEARASEIESTSLALRGDAEFRIEQSVVESGRTTDLPADLAPCSSCLRELEDPGDRRYRYPFINCTGCGPRFTIVEGPPYDRARTTMRAFAMCPACRREYEDPADRRFHAQPIACSACGPRLFIPATSLRGEQALAAAVAALWAGGIVAVKGAGGFLLAADATSPGAVRRLRQRKRQPDQPLAVMTSDLAHARRIADVDPAAERALQHPARPIVLVPRRVDGPLSACVAPGLADVGLCMPPTPLQHLLLADGPPWQVTTSGNRCGAPIVCTNEDAATQLGEIADLVLAHDRPIHARADDSVVRIVAGAATPLRRARGYVPMPLVVPRGGPAVLAVGGQDEGVMCLAAQGRALLSGHLGRLDHPDVQKLFERTSRSIAVMAGATPELVAHDLHPDYRSTQWALESGLPCVAVQHHHAHVAACLTEHGRRGPAIGVVFDGSGLGPDGTSWGGEFLVADLRGFERRGHLAALALPGGDPAMHDPWQLAVAALREAGEDLGVLADAVDPGRLDAVDRLLCGALSPRAHGAGRWFDVVAALCGVVSVASYDGRATMQLEAAAASEETVEAYPFALAGEPFTVELASVVRAIVDDRRHGVPVPRIAARFHETLAHAVWRGCARLRRAGAPRVVALTGGCFVNRRLAERCAALLDADGFEVLLHRRVPAGDGGLCLGQAAVAIARRGRQG